MFFLAEVYREYKKEDKSSICGRASELSAKSSLRSEPLFYTLDIPFTHLKKKWKKH